MLNPGCRSLLPVLTVALAGLLLTACGSATSPAAAPSGPRFAATIRVDSAAKGVGLKVNGTLVATQLPADIAFEVTEAGRARQSYRIALNRNAMAITTNTAPSAMAGDQLDPTAVTINMDEALPARIYFDTVGPLITGTAVVDRVR
jgi:hypothetical protein